MMVVEVRVIVAERVVDGAVRRVHRVQVDVLTLRVDRVWS